MLHLFGSGVRLCDGLTRRELLRVGGLALTGLALPRLLEARAACAGAPQASRARAKSCIQIFLWGGPAQQETWDLKPDAPSAHRGTFRPIASRVPGTQICEHLPLLAERTDRFAIIRSLTHPGVNHGTSAYHMLTGHMHPSPGTLRHPTKSDMPGIGSAVARFHASPAGLPAWVALPSIVRDGDGGEVPGQGPGILGQRYAPFLVEGDLTRGDFAVPAVTVPAELAGGRLAHRLGLREALDRQADYLSRQPPGQALNASYDAALRLIGSAAAERAFDLSAEPARVRERYGMHHFAQALLLARRLVEAGVPLVTVYWNSPSNADNQSWDTHTDSFRRLGDHLLPAFDRAFSALLDDLSQRGLSDETLVTAMGEFGRTPKINRTAGRDHWGFCQSIVLAGAGVRGGVVHGSSDRSGGYPATCPVSPDDVAATIFDSLGIELGCEMLDPQGRPIRLTGGAVIGGIL
jgi:hypothetical protein